MPRCDECQSQVSHPREKVYVRGWDDARDRADVLILCPTCRTKYRYDRQYTPRNLPRGGRRV
ncbi:hypothetical protein [Haloarchaeobius sp. DFWS5]|uniref:hypothetical protein n=1 Tax=Haloarchaeobius sp. DFWS5 TaxID=3446114 RepID=UPI003EB75F14